MRIRLLPVLIVVALLAVGLRLGDLWQGLSRTALAQGGQDQAVSSPTPVGEPERGGQPPAETAAKPAGPQPIDPFSLTDSEIELLQKLAARREQIEMRALEIERRAALLSAAETRIEDRIAELKALQGRIEALLQLRDEQEEAQLRSLVKIYQNMKPKDAARIFEELEMPVLLEVIDRMSERKSAPILAKMKPSKAKSVTVQLAERHKVPLELK